MLFSKPFTNVTLLEDKTEGKKVKAAFEFDNTTGNEITITIGISPVDEAGAMHNWHLASDPITFEEIKKVGKYIDSKLGILYDAISQFKPKKLVGCSGTFDSFRAMIIAKNGGIPEEVKKSISYPINIADYEKLHIDLINSTLEERKKMEGLELVRV